LLAITFMADDGTPFPDRPGGNGKVARGLSASGRACIKRGVWGVSHSVGRKAPGVADAPSGWGIVKVQAAISLSGTREVVQQDSLDRHRAGPIPSRPFGFVYTETFPLAANPRQIPERL